MSGENLSREIKRDKPVSIDYVDELYFIDES